MPKYNGGWLGCGVALRLWMNFQILWDSGIRFKFIHLSRRYGEVGIGRQGMERKEGIANNGTTNCWCGWDWVMLMPSRVALCLRMKIREKFIHIFHRFRWLGCHLSVQAGRQMKSDICFFFGKSFFWFKFKLIVSLWSHGEISIN